MPSLILARCTCSPTVDVGAPVEDEGVTLTVTHEAACGTVDLRAENDKLRGQVDRLTAQLAVAEAASAAEVAVTP